MPAIDRYIRILWPESEWASIREKWDSLEGKFNARDEATYRDNAVTKLDCSVLILLCSKLVKTLDEYAEQGYQNNELCGDADIITVLDKLNNKIEEIKERQCT